MKSALILQNAWTAVGPYRTSIPSRLYSKNRGYHSNPLLANQNPPQNFMLPLFYKKKKKIMLRKKYLLHMYKILMLRKTSVIFFF